MSVTAIPNLDNIPIDILSMIYRRLEPKDVFLLCQVSHRFADYSKRPELWIMLIREHYPTYQLTETPHQQYRALAHNHISYYYVNSVTPFEYDDVAYLEVHLKAYADDLASIRKIEVKGLPVSNETELWVVCVHSQHRSFTWSEEVVSYVAYNTREEAVDSVVDDLYSDFLHLVESQQEDSDYFVTLTLDEVAKDLELPTPLTEKRWHEWLMVEGSGFSCHVGETYLAIDINLVKFHEGHIIR